MSGLVERLRELLAEPFDVLEVEYVEGEVTDVEVVRADDLRALLAEQPEATTDEQHRFMFDVVGFCCSGCRWTSRNPEATEACEEWRVEHAPDPVPASTEDEEVEALAEAVCVSEFDRQPPDRWENTSEWGRKQYRKAARRILASDWFARHDAARDAALREQIAQAIEAGLLVADSSPEARWVRDRAAGIAREVRP